MDKATSDTEKEKEKNVIPKKNMKQKSKKKLKT